MISRFLVIGLICAATFGASRLSRRGTSMTIANRIRSELPHT